jgi:segregation and condensation protein A
MSEYRVQLDIYSGPLDLLLYLVRRNEVDSVALRISAITQQFLEYLEVLEFIDIDLAGEFVALASALVEIKSRLVLPRTEEEEPEPEIAESHTPGQLIQQLLTYKKFKDAAHALEERAAEWQERFPRLSDDRPSQGKDLSADRIKEVELWDLVSALSRVLRQKVVEQQASIRYDDTPVAVYAERISARVRAEGRVAFSAFFDGTNMRSKIVGIFLAILELLRHHQFRAEQPADYGEIWILPPLPPTAAIADDAAHNSAGY